MTLLEPTGQARVETVIRRSRFVGYGVPAATTAAADNELKRIKGEHSDASHVVHAYLVGVPAREIGSLSDAGEPKGTAGRPVMEILRGSGVRNVMIVVVRYFGGVKLGTGGLVHAYGDAARAVLREMPTRPLVIRERLTVITDYARHEPIHRALVDCGAEILSEEFDTGVQIDVSIEQGSVTEVERLIADLSAGSADIRRHTP
ncbi:MAG: IMPACT family protein [Spirochaetales bacterium]|nr:IMPACT family protein [Spirochaetales bacterium]